MTPVASIHRDTSRQWRNDTIEHVDRPEKIGAKETVDHPADKLSLCFRVLDETISVDSPKLPDRIRMDQLLPVLKNLDDQAIAIAVRKDGNPTTCAKGCSMCCRLQLVPITPSEAYEILCLVESLPEPRRSAVLERFSERAARLHDAGLAENYLEGREPENPEQARDRLGRYQELGLICPFLEDDACSIYEMRPFACREYLVTTPKEFCARPLTEPVKRVPIILVPAIASMETAASQGGIRQSLLPLTLAVEYAREHREVLDRTYPAMVLLAQSIQRMFMSAYAHGSIELETK
jgi:Fe-S-cluster containining protein